MLGCGETPDQVISTMEKGYVFVVNGRGSAMLLLASGPMVRSSYKAGEFYIKAMIEADRAKATAAHSSA